MTKNTYQENKKAARNEAIEWQFTTAQEPMYWSELAEWQEHFERLGRRYGLLREFRENGIC